MSPRFAQPSDLLGHPRLGEHEVGRRVIGTLAVLSLLAVLVAWWHHEASSSKPAPNSLASVRLAGPRGPGCIRLIIGNDVSGSMTAFATARSGALSEIRDWARQNLRSDDQIGVLDFAVNAGWEATPDGGSEGPPASVVHDGMDTDLDPVVDLVGQLPASSCETALVLLSDAQLADLPRTADDGRGLLRGQTISDVFLLVPGSAIQVPRQWTTAFPEAAPLRFDGTDPRATGLAIGKVVAALTRQTLKHV